MKGFIFLLWQEVLCVYMLSFTYVCVCVCVYIYIYIYMHLHTHMYVCTLEISNSSISYLFHYDHRECGPELSVSCSICLAGSNKFAGWHYKFPSHCYCRIIQLIENNLQLTLVLFIPQGHDLMRIAL